MRWKGSQGEWMARGQGHWDEQRSRSLGGKRSRSFQGKGGQMSCIFMGFHCNFFLFSESWTRNSCLKMIIFPPENLVWLAAPCRRIEYWLVLLLLSGGKVWNYPWNAGKASCPERGANSRSILRSPPRRSQSQGTLPFQFTSTWPDSRYGLPHGLLFSIF